MLYTLLKNAGTVDVRLMGGVLVLFAFVFAFSRYGAMHFHDWGTLLTSLFAIFIGGIWVSVASIYNAADLATFTGPESERPMLATHAVIAAIVMVGGGFVAGVLSFLEAKTISRTTAAAVFLGGISLFAMSVNTCAWTIAASREGEPFGILTGIWTWSRAIAITTCALFVLMTIAAGIVEIVRGGLRHRRPFAGLAEEERL